MTFLPRSDAADERYDHVDTLEWEHRMYVPVVGARA